jgi:hypothetical protein
MIVAGPILLFTVIYLVLRLKGWIGPEEELQLTRARRVEEQRVEEGLSEWVDTHLARNRYSMLPELVSVGVETETKRKESGWMGTVMERVKLRGT